MKASLFGELNDKKLRITGLQMKKKENRKKKKEKTSARYSVVLHKTDYAFPGYKQEKEKGRRQRRTNFRTSQVSSHLLGRSVGSNLRQARRCEKKTQCVDERPTILHDFASSKRCRDRYVSCVAVNIGVHGTKHACCAPTSKASCQGFLKVAQGIEVHVQDIHTDRYLFQVGAEAEFGDRETLSPDEPFERKAPRLVR